MWIWNWFINIDINLIYSIIFCILYIISYGFYIYKKKKRNSIYLGLYSIDGVLYEL